MHHQHHVHPPQRNAPKTLTIGWRNFSRHQSLLLCFDKFIKGDLTLEQNYVAWKVIEARPGSGSVTLNFSGRAGIAQCETDSENIVRASTFVELPSGSHVNFEKGVDEIPVWGKVIPSPRMGNLIKGRNVSGVRQDFSIGTVADRHDFIVFEPAFHWEGIGQGLPIEAEFHPTLVAFVGYGYQEGELVTEDLAGEEIWKRDLAKLASVTKWDFVETDQGGYDIKQTH